jgi:divalent metal cation (Fe/Co/Zn/Cd) transporter
VTTVELPQRPQAEIPRHEYLRLARRAKQLSWLSLAYMAVEGGVALTAGIIAASPALIGFGIDSAIEGVASLVIVWRFTGARLLSAAAERRAQTLVAVQFFLLAPYVGYESLDALVGGERPDASWVGIGLSITSLLLMPWLGRLKQRLGERMGSVALRGEGQQTSCAPTSPRRGEGCCAPAVSGSEEAGAPASGESEECCHEGPCAR